MIDNHISLPDPQSGSKTILESGPSLVNEKLSGGGPSGTKKNFQSDKEVLLHLVQLGLEDVSAKGDSIDLDTNEEVSRIIPVLCSYLSNEELKQLFGEQATTGILEMHRIEMLQNLFLERELQQVLHAFNESHIPLLLLKGPVLAHTCYPNAHMRTYHDIDALIHPDDLPSAHEVLTKMGYTFYEEYRGNVVDRGRTGYNYMLKSQGAWFQVPIELHTAPHSSEVGSTFKIESIWVNARPTEILGEATLMMKPIDHLLYLCWHYRFHSFSRLLWLYDLVMLLRTFESELDWQELVDAAYQQHLATTLYFCLSWCQHLFGVAVPNHVYARLHPPLLCRLIVERIAMPDVAKVLAGSSEIVSRVLAHRVMVDSPLDLFKAGINTLFPSPVFIRQRYMNNSRLSLKLFFLFYFIHPWNTLAKGCRYLLMSGNKWEKER